MSAAGTSRSQACFEPEIATSDPNTDMTRRHGSEFGSDTNNKDDQRDDAEALSRRPGSPARDDPVTWMMIPRKDQLAILFLCRVVDFLQVASLQAYVFFQLKSFDDSLSDAQISTQAGILQGCFTGAQVLTAVLWGKAADASWCGRKMVILVGLAGTAVSCLGYSFTTSFFWAAFWRAFGGGINGTVGTIRTMISEITKEKKYQSRAFLILPMSFNVANAVGPVMGGLFASAATTLPGLFAESGLFAFQWIRNYPYALPSVLNAVFLSLVALAVFFLLEETSIERRGRFDLGLYLRARLKNLVARTPSAMGYSALQTYDAPEVAMDRFDKGSEIGSNLIGPGRAGAGSGSANEGALSQKLPFSRVWTRNVVLTLVATAFFDFQLGAFQNLWALFLSTPRAGDSATSTSASGDNGRTSLHGLGGGLGMPASKVGIATSFLGILGMLLQVFLYPPVHARLGTLRSFQWFLYLFPVAYFLAPYLAVLSSSSPPPEPASGLLVWLSIVVVLLLQVAARTFTMPANIILLNNCSPHPSVLGTVHGLGQSVSAGFRTVGPVVGGWWYGAGLDAGHVEAGWWGVAVMASLGCGSAMWIYEGNGHEIYLPGE